MFRVEHEPGVNDVAGRPEDEELENNDEEHLDDALLGCPGSFRVGLTHGAVGVEPAEWLGRHDGFCGRLERLVRLVGSAAVDETRGGVAAAVVEATATA